MAGGREGAEETKRNMGEGCGQKRKPTSVGVSVRGWAPSHTDQAQGARAPGWNGGTPQAPAAQAGDPPPQPRQPPERRTCRTTRSGHPHGPRRRALPQALRRATDDHQASPRPPLPVPPTCLPHPIATPHAAPQTLQYAAQSADKKGAQRRRGTAQGRPPPLPPPQKGTTHPVPLTSVSSVAPSTYRTCGARCRRRPGTTQPPGGRGRSCPAA